MIARLLSGHLDMVVGSRLQTEATEAFRAGHHLGNKLLTGTVSYIFGDRFDDMLSGYRIFSRRFVKSFPAVSAGFETETELAVHCAEPAPAGGGNGDALWRAAGGFGQQAQYLPATASASPG